MGFIFIKGLLIILTQDLTTYPVPIPLIKNFNLPPPSFNLIIHHHHLIIILILTLTLILIHLPLINLPPLLHLLQLPTTIIPINLIFLP